MSSFTITLAIVKTFYFFNLFSTSLDQFHPKWQIEFLGANGNQNFQMKDHNAHQVEIIICIQQWKHPKESIFLDHLTKDSPLHWDMLKVKIVFHLNVF